MLKEIIVNVAEEETRVAVLEDKTLVELYIERSLNQRLVGNIYKGRVENVLPGMQAAFVNIGLEKNAFLYVEDALPNRHHLAGSEPKYKESLERARINDVLKVGQEIVVQITKEPIGTKGPRVTTHLTLPGRYLVLMPCVDYIGISRRIEDETERERLHSIAEKSKPAGMGVIVRTVAEGTTEQDIQQDIFLLSKVWKKIQHRSAHGTTPNIIHKDVELVQRILRDLFTEDIDSLIIDSRYEYEKVIELLDIIGPPLKAKTKLVENENIFETYNLETEIDKILKRKVWLKCGGYLVIDRTEALTAIDVNTGKYVGTSNLADTVLRTNMDAAVEIARQLRLRNLGGIIVIDFIDMSTEDDQRRVLQALEEGVKKDKTKTNVLGITQLGLVEVTRKKVRQGLESVLQKICPYCDGKGKVYSEETVSIQVRQQLLELAERTQAETISVEVHPGVAALLIGSGGTTLRELENRTQKTIIVKGSDAMHIEKFNLQAVHGKVLVEGLVPVQLGQILQLKIEEPHVANMYDGIARLNGFVIDVEGAGPLIGEDVQVEIINVHRTYAKAKILG